MFFKLFAGINKYQKNLVTKGDWKDYCQPWQTTEEAYCEKESIISAHCHYNDIKPKCRGLVWR